jgi:putative tryptophan/tyrosine transport system permease protein
MNLLIGSLTIGFILSLLALGVYISFRIFAFPDMTADGSITLGAAVAAVLLVHGTAPVLATAAGAAAGAVAGAATGLLHTRLKVHGMLSSILVMTALYSVNLHVMGRSNVPLLTVRTLASQAEQAVVRVLPSGPLVVLGWEVPPRDAAVLVLAFLVANLIALGLFWFFRTELGTAMRATGDNPQMIRAQGVHTGNMLLLGLTISNSLIALSGALLAQYQGFADVQMGIGMVVWGLASVIIGQVLVRGASLGITLVGALMGSVLFRLLVAIALRWGLNPNDLKLVTAAFVLAALVVPGLVARLRRRRTEVASA